MKDPFSLVAWFTLALSILLSDIYGQPLGGEQPITVSNILEGGPTISSVVSNPFDPDDKTTGDITCNSFGFFPITGSCTEFYLCKNVDHGMDKQPSSWSIFTFTCPLGMIFEKQKKLCVVPLIMHVPHESQKEEIPTILTDRCENQTQINTNVVHANNFLPEASDFLNRRKRAVVKADTKNVACKSEEALSIASTTQDICSDVSSIDVYVAHVKTLEGARLPVFTKEKYARIIKNYNRDLEIANNNVKIWGQESLLLATMREAVLSATGFGEVFNREFKLNLNRIGIIVDSEGLITSGSDMVVKNTKEQMIKLGELLELIKNSSDSAIIINQMKIIKQQLDAYERAQETFATKYEIPEIIKFLENVQNGANNIFSKAEDAGNMMSEFEYNILQDSSRFSRHGHALNAGMAELVKDKISNQEEVLRVQRDIENFTKKSANVGRTLLDVRSKKTSATNRLWNLRISRSKRSPLHPAVLIVGGLLVGWGVKEILDEDDPEYWEIEIQDLEKQISSLEAQIKSIEGNLVYYNNRRSSLQNRSNTLERYISYMDELDDSFKVLGKEVRSVSIPVNNAKNAVMKIKIVFQDVIVKLESLIDEAKKAQQALESRNIRYLLYNEIGIMKCLWDEVSERLTPFVDCL